MPEFSNESKESPDLFSNLARQKPRDFERKCRRELKEGVGFFRLKQCAALDRFLLIDSLSGSSWLHPR
jgi:hypothetical protein